MTFKLTIKEVKSPHFMEREKRFNVLVNDCVVDELYYNMTGYCGSLMTVHGNHFNLGEKCISAWMKEARGLNKEAKEILAACAADPMQLLRTTPTSNGDRVNAVFGAPGQNEIEGSIERKRLASAAAIFSDRIPRAYFDGDFGDLLPVASLATAVHPDAGTSWAETRYSLAFLKTTDDDWTAIITGFTPDAERFVTGRMNAADMTVDETTSIVFLRTQTLLELNNSMPQLRMGALRASALPGRGFASDTAPFTEMVTSTSQRPEIILADQDLWATEIIARHGLRVAAPEAEPERDVEMTDGPGM